MKQRHSGVDRPADSEGRSQRGYADSPGWNRLIAPGAALFLCTAAVGVALFSHHVTSRQEVELLGQRANEVTALLSANVSGVRTALSAAGAAIVAADTSALEAEVSGEDAVPGISLVVTSQRNGVERVVGGMGSAAPASGSVIAPELAAVIGRARTTPNVVTAIVQHRGDPHIVLALALPGDPAPVTLIASPIAQFDLLTAGADSPYRELNVAAYLSGDVAGTPVVISGDVPRGESVVRREIRVGADTWLVRISARSPLAGPIAQALPWILLGSGLFSALVVGALVELLVRRRTYAVRLVAERTLSLHNARVEADRANRAKSDFLSRMSHELRTPLNSVLGFAQLLEMDDLTSDQRDAVAQIRKGGAHLLDLINETLDISRIESGKMSLHVEPVRVRDVVTSVVELVNPIAVGRGIEIFVGHEVSDDLYVRADRQRLKQILLNLVSNGIKYNRVGGSISILASSPVPGTVRIAVADTGRGIEEHDFGLVFEPFERLGADRFSVEGTGVGLALARGLAEAMGGTLGLESVVGLGSTFSLELPRATPISTESAADEVPLARAGHDRSVVAAVTDQPTVLYIEDNPANVQLIERAFAQRPGIRMLSAPLGRTGVELARGHRPALVLLDLNLPDISGCDVLAMLRANPETAGIPIVILSADAMPSQIESLLAAGAEDYLTKPVDIGRLLALVDQAVAGDDGAGSSADVELTG